MALKAEYEAWFNRGRSFIQILQAPCPESCSERFAVSFMARSLPPQ